MTRVWVVVVTDALGRRHCFGPFTTREVAEAVLYGWQRHGMTSPPPELLEVEAP